MSAYLSDVISIIRDLLRDDAAEISADTLFEALPGWEYMDLVRVVVEVEYRFDVRFEPAEIDRLSTVDDLFQGVAAKQARAAA